MVLFHHGDLKRLGTSPKMPPPRIAFENKFPIVRLFANWDAVLDAMAAASGRQRPTHQEQRKWARAGQIPRMYELALRRYCADRRQYCEASDFIATPST
jgi:hypothetical protein